MLLRAERSSNGLVEKGFRHRCGAVCVLRWAFFRVTYRPASGVVETTRTKTSTPPRRKGALSPLHRDPLMPRGLAEHSGSFPSWWTRTSRASFILKYLFAFSFFSCPVSSHFWPSVSVLSSCTGTLLPPHRQSNLQSAFSREGVRTRPQ